MMRTALIVLSFLLCQLGHSQERFYNFVDGWMNNFSVELESEYLLLGLEIIGSASQHEYLYNHINESGVLVGQSVFSSDTLFSLSSRMTSSMAIQVNQELIVVGYLADSISGSILSRGVVYSYSMPNGPFELLRVLEGDEFDQAYSIAYSNDSTLIIAGYLSDNNGSRRLYVQDINLAAESRWTFESSCGLWCHSRPEQILPLSDGGIAVLFYEFDNSLPTFYQTQHAVLLKLNALGEEEWRHNLGDWENHRIDPGGMVEVDEQILVSYTDPDYLIASGSQQGMAQYNDSNTVHLAWYALDGSLVEEIDYLEEIYNSLDSARVLYDINQTQLLNDGSILLSGSTGPGGLIMKVNQSGDIIWFREHLKYPLELTGGFSQEMILRHVLPTSDGGFLGTGEFNSTPSDWNPGFINTAIALKLDEYGCLEPGCQLVGLEEWEVQESTFEVYPNPVSGYEINIRFPQVVQLESAVLVDGLGRVHDLKLDGLRLNPRPQSEYNLKLQTSNSSTSNQSWSLLPHTHRCGWTGLYKEFGDRMTSALQCD